MMLRIMRFFMPALASLLAGAALGASVAAAAPADAVPHIDPTPSCKGASRGGDPKADLKNCLQEEQDAHTRLSQDWGKFRADDRASCAALATLGGSPSYVELLTCLEMAAAARESPADTLAGNIPTAAAPDKPYRVARRRHRVIRAHWWPPYATGVSWPSAGC